MKLHHSCLAIVFQSPQHLSVRGLDLPAPGVGEAEVEVEFSGISTGTERLLWDGSMPAFPGLGYPLVPGDETVARVIRTGPQCQLSVGQRVFVPGSSCFQDVKSLFGGAASRLVVPQNRVVVVQDHLQERAVLLALAATAYHAVALGGRRQDIVAPDLIIGHGVMGRLLARLVVAAGLPAPTVWETNPVRQLGGEGYSVIHPDEDSRKDYQAIYDVSGDGTLLNGLISRLAHGGEVVLAGFYTQNLSFAYPPAFMREAQIRVASEWKKPDLLAVTELIHNGRLSLDGLLTHTQTPDKALEAYEVAFSDPHCLKMVMDWRN
jgi:3-hydroxyethyl bacteriochlorophyllide a dehydrogenase